MKWPYYIVFLLTTTIFAQDKHLTRTGTIHFEASVPSFEEVAAKNQSSTAILDTKTGAFASLVLIQGFRFKNALMEEHFNENYAESSTYPKATFKGRIADFSMNALKASKKDYQLSGVLTFHGVSKPIEGVALKVNKHQTSIFITGQFVVSASDFNIKIPKIVANKVSENVTVRFEFELMPQ